MIGGMRKTARKKMAGKNNPDPFILPRTDDSHRADKLTSIFISPKGKEKSKEKTDEKDNENSKDNEDNQNYKDNENQEAK